jgi:tetratricopeptide (TPR) repeat protein
VRVILFTLAFTLAASAADEQQLALIMKAQADFDRVDLAATPRLPDTSACVLSQAALLPVSPPAELPMVHFRKGYCTMVQAGITQQAPSYVEAAGEFQKAIDAWAGRVAAQPKKTAPEPLPAALPVLAAISRMRAAPGDSNGIAAAQQQIATALKTPACPSTVMPLAACQADLQAGREWLGWIALSNDKLAEAAQLFSAFPNSGWPQWVSGRQAFQSGNYAEAVKQYRAALDVWQRTRPERLAPQADMGLALTDLGGAQLLSGDNAGAIATLDLAVKTDPAHARTFYYRARAKELAGRGDAAIADYNLAARTAFASAVELNSGEAHLYRGISAFRGKEFARAEDEFSSALNFAIPAALRPDTVAWRHLAAVAAGNCAASRGLLSSDLTAVSPLFPKSEASAMIAACPTASANK